MTVRDLLLAPAARSLLAGGGVLAVLAAVTLLPEAPRRVEVPALALEAREPAAAVHEVALEEEAPEPEAAEPLASIRPSRTMDAIEDPADFTFAVEIGGTTYIRLGDLAVDADRDRAELVQDDYVTSAIAPISAGALPEELRPWRGRRVLVNGTCAARVVGFAEIGRVSGDPYVVSPDEDRAGARWTVETAFSHGRTMIAGALDRDCRGSWARAADRPAIGRAIAVADARLERAARGAFLAAYADLIAAGWREAGQAGDWRDHVTLEARIVQHSLTGARWAYVHARKSGGCGDHDVNVAATYRAAADGSLTAAETAGFPGSVLEALVDLDGDGWFARLVVHTDPADRSLVGPVDETELAAIDVPFHGCGC